MMQKTVKVCRDGDTADVSCWALAYDENSRLDIATRLVEELWCAAKGGKFPRMDRKTVSLSRL